MMTVHLPLSISMCGPFPNNRKDLSAFGGNGNGSFQNLTKSLSCWQTETLKRAQTPHHQSCLCNDNICIVALLASRGDKTLSSALAGKEVAHVLLGEASLRCQRKVRQIEQMEAKLKAEVLLPMRQRLRSQRDTVEELWEAVDDTTVVTLREAFNDFVAKGLQVQYHRLPVTPENAVRISHFDVIFDLCLDNPVTPVMYNCQTGRVRSTMAMVTTAIVRFYQHCTKDFDADLSILKGNGMSANFRTLVKLVALLPSGSLHERRVAVLSELAGKISSLTEHILTAFKTDVSKKALAHLAQYAHLIAFSCFCEQRLWSKTFKGTFSEWVSSNAEVRVLLNSITDQTPTPAGYPVSAWCDGASPDCSRHSPTHLRQH